MLLENVLGARLTNDLYQKWKVSTEEPIQIHSKEVALANLTMPELAEATDPEILNDPLNSIKKSSAYPYGLSERMIEKLQEAEINTIRNLYEAPEDKLDAIPYIGEYRIKQLKNIVAQAIWL
jgi:DNA-directed RNA polymerase alpha subunit